MLTVCSIKSFAEENMMRNPNSEVSGQSLKAQDGLQDGLQDSLKVPKKAKNTVRSNRSAVYTVPKSRRAPKF